MANGDLWTALSQFSHDYSWPHRFEPFQHSPSSLGFLMVSFCGLLLPEGWPAYRLLYHVPCGMVLCKRLATISLCLQRQADHDGRCSGDALPAQPSCEPLPKLVWNECLNRLIQAASRLWLAPDLHMTAKCFGCIAIQLMTAEPQFGFSWSVWPRQAGTTKHLLTIAGSALGPEVGQHSAVTRRCGGQGRGCGLGPGVACLALRLGGAGGHLGVVCSRGAPDLAAILGWASALIPAPLSRQRLHGHR